MKYATYQINNEKDQASRFFFLDFENMKREAGGRIPMEIYDKVYEGEIESSETEIEWTLERIFAEFNISRAKHPNFRGHSLSVSDIVELDGVRWFCDSFGWKRIVP